MTSEEHGADADAYLRERAAPPGSSLYYCTLFVPAPQARRSIALQAFRLELDDIIDDCREPAVAAARLGWWHEELERLALGEPQHPVTRVLTGLLGHRDTAAEHLTKTVAATAAASAQPSWADETALQRYCLDTGGEIAAVDCADEEDIPRARNVGAAVCAHDMLADLWRRPRRGCQVFPATGLAAAGVTPADLFTVPTPPAADRLVRDRAVELRGRLADELAGWHPRVAAAHVLVARARIALATLDAISRGGPDWLARHTAVSPLRRLWIAWRTTRGI